MFRWLISALMSACFLVSFAHADDAPLRTISVTGDAEVRVVPDEVLVSLQVQTRNKQLAAAQSENEKALATALKIIVDDFDVDEKHVQSDYIDIQPVYFSCNYQQQQRGECNPLAVQYYQVNKGLQLRLKKLDKFQELMTAMLNAGVTNIQNVQFTTSELRKHRDAAREKAAKAAREKADAVATVLEVEVVKPVTINVGHIGVQPYRSSGRMAMAQNVLIEADAHGAAGGPTMAPGQIIITANVNVTFEIE